MDSTPVPETPEEAAQHISPLGRVLGVFWEPKRTFADIVDRPGWWVPLIVMALAGLGFIIVIQHTIGIDVVLRQQLERAPQLQDMSAAQREQVIATQLRFLPFGMYFGVLVGAPVFYLLVSLVLMVAFRVIHGSEVRFKQAFGITTHAFLPTLISGILSMFVMQFINPADFNMENPVMSNLGWLVSSDAAAWLRTLAGSIDLFSIWVMFLLAVGFAATKRKLTTGAAFATVLPFWLVMVLLRVGSAAAFG